MRLIHEELHSFATSQFRVLTSEFLWFSASIFQHFQIIV